MRLPAPSLKPLHRALKALPLGACLALAQAPAAWAWGAAPASQPNSQPVVSVPLRFHGPELLGHTPSLGLRSIFFANSVLGPSRLGGAGYQDSGAFILDGDLRVTRKDTLFSLPLGPLGRVAPAFSTYVGLRGISTATHAVASTGGTSATPGPNDPPAIPVEDRIPTPQASSAPALVGHNLYGGLVAGSEASILLPLGFTAHAGASLSTLVFGMWDRRPAGFLGVPEAYLGGTQNVQRGSINALGVVLPGGSVGVRWGLGKNFSIGLGYELMTLPTDLRAQTGPSFALGRGLSAFSFANVDLRLVDLSF